MIVLVVCDVWCAWSSDGAGVENECAEIEGWCVC